MIVILPAAPHDAEVIHAIQMRAFAEEARLSGTEQIPPLMEDVAAVEHDVRTHTVLTARDGDQIVGSARGVIKGAACLIHRVSVEPTYQGKGIGAKLIDAVEQLHATVERFELTTNTLVPGNVEFYERRGYTVTQRRNFSDKIVLVDMQKMPARTL
ncbi:MAG: N-acetyltransferase [Betaproteobacteria bacterium]|nr:MAG: N-acetyltransferase [Betaproteobacteria bacterium]